MDAWSLGKSPAHLRVEDIGQIDTGITDLVDLDSSDVLPNEQRKYLSPNISQATYVSTINMTENLKSSWFKELPLELDDPADLI